MTDVTSYSGLLLIEEAMRALKVDKSVEKHLHIKERERGFSEYDYVRAFVFLLSAGGEHLDDIEQLRGDAGLRRLFEIPSSSAIRTFLYQFHDEQKMKDKPPDGAFIPDESDNLKALDEVNAEIILNSFRDEGERVATLEPDATVIESNKEEACWTYLGVKGYQPQIVWWVEGDKILSDQFRDGNVPSRMETLPLIKKAIYRLPRFIQRIYIRGDSAFYEHTLLDWLRDGYKNEDALKKKEIYFAVSAVMSEELKAEIRALVA